MIIAEFCQNHNGDFELLSQMAIAAAESGATHGKMQTIFADNIAFRPQFEEGLSTGDHYQCIKRPYQQEYDRLKGLEISFDQSRQFCELCRNIGLEPVTTCFARENVQSLAELGFDTIKIASYDCASFQMLREVKEHFGTIIVSTGATFDDEIERATAILDGSNFALLHCVTIYPTPIEQLHLTRLEFLRNYCDKVGFSDHTLVARDGLIGSKASLALGADIIERHFTLLEPDQTKDGPVSINPQQLRELADFAALPVESRLQVMDKSYPQWRQTIGKQNRFLSDIELSNRDYFRGRFASRRPETKSGAPMIFNWEEVPLP